MVTAEDLGALKTDDWLYLRNSISDGMQGSGYGISAVCGACDHPVYVHAPVVEGRPPFFKHRTGAPTSCPWYTGEARTPEGARADQYDGEKESVLHKRYCELILKLAAQDDRYVEDSGTVGRYLRPEGESPGRYPDVFFRWGEKKFAFEFQLANSMQPEIAGRDHFYRREGVVLIWVLGRFPPDVRLRSGHADIIHRHRGNAFVLDEAAISMSCTLRTLCLTVFMQNEDGSYDTRTEPVDHLHIPRHGLAFLEDRTVAPAIERVDRLRAEIAATARAAKGTYCSLNLPGLEHVVPYEADRFVAVALSIWSAACGKFENFLNGQANLRGLLNAYFNSADGKQYATILNPLIRCNKAAEAAGEKLLERIKRCIEEEAQCDFDSFEGSYIVDLFPEIFDSALRQRWLLADALPDWAVRS